MKCKKAIMGLAALMIVAFHFYIPVSTKNVLEMTLYRATFIGVDMFFFVSAYSLASRKPPKYWDFLKNRILSVYVPFVFLAGVAAVYSKWKLSRFLQVISGQEFFKRGGGSFLWFDVAIMLVYIAAPGIAWLKQKWGLKLLPAAIVLWAGLVILCQYVFKYTTIFILLNRLPIFFLGLYYRELRDWMKTRKALLFIVPGLLIGGYMIYKWGGVKYLNKPLKELYYIAAIPFTLAFIGLFDYVTTRLPLKFRILEFIGGFSLELYGLQMIFGFNIESKLLKATKQGTLSFLLTALILILMAFVFSKVRGWIMNEIKKKN